jgi:hypothetical protein
MEPGYIQAGDYQIPDVTLGADPEENANPLGKYARMRKAFLKEYRSGTYNTMVLSNTLKKRLLEVDRAARERMEQLMDSLLKQYPAPDKAKDQMAWVGHMNNLKHMAEEVILDELVYS